MNKPVQQRALITRAKILATAEALIGEAGFEAMRVDEVVKRAGVAKGTFFAHFKDKDALMDKIIGGRIDAALDQMSQAPAPQTPKEMVQAMAGVIDVMTCERYVFDVILRYSGAAAIEEIGPIAMTFGRHMIEVGKWIHTGPYRNDIGVELLAEGVQAFMIQAMALKFCALHNATTVDDRLETYLQAWLTPRVG